MASKIFVVLVLVAVLCLIHGQEFVQEEPCSRAGGQCLLKRDCSNTIPDQYLNLCPRQKRRGAECCHGYSLSETKCQKLGGECFQKGYCNEDFELKRAKDCAQGEVCCLLV